MTALNISNFGDLLSAPTDDDLKGTALGLLRLQKTYKISASSIADGFLNEKGSYRQVFSHLF